MQSKKLIINNPKNLSIRRNLRRTQTPQEIILWSKLRSRGTGYKWKRQVSIGKYIIDFYCPEKRLAVEIDGIQHDDNKEYDVERTEYLKTQGITVLRFWNNEVNTNIEGVLLMIMKIIETTSP